MRIQTRGLALLAGGLFAISACTPSGASPSASASAPASASPSTEPSASASTEPSASAGTEWTIGVVTDVGTVNDKNFNEYTYAGAVAGAQALGITEEVPVFVPKDASEYATGLQSYIDQGFNIIVTAGFALTNDTATAAKNNPDVWFIGVDQAACVDETGTVDTTFTCAGNAAELLPNLIGLQYQEDQPGYLAGMAAAGASQNGKIGAIGGITLCGPCIRYIQGYELGAKAVNPDIEVVSAYVSESDFVKAFNDPVTGKSFGAQFITQNGVDVLFQVAGKTGNGILDAACEAGILGIGVDVDQALSYPNAAACTLTSAEKKLKNSVEQTIVAISDGSAKPGIALFNAANDGIGLSPYTASLADRVPADVQTAIDAALAEMKAGTLTTCPENCGSLQ